MRRSILTSVFLFLLFSCNPDENLPLPGDFNTMVTYTKVHGLADNWINALYEDSKGNIWIGTANGLSKYDGTTFKNYTTADGLLGNDIYAIVEDVKGNIWVGTGSGANIFFNNTWYFLNYFQGTPVYSLLSIPNNNNVLIGTGGFGVFRSDMNYNIADYYRPLNCTPCNNINTLFLSSDYSVWIGSFGGAVRIKGITTTVLTTQNNLPDNTVLAIGEDSWNNIWMGTFNGKNIAKFNGNRIEQVSYYNGATQNWTYAFAKDKLGTLWFGTVANGLYRYDGAIMKRVYKDLNDITVTSLLCDSKGNVWIGTPLKGLSKYTPDPYNR